MQDRDQNIEAENPIVFISYSHDSPDHRKWVAHLATRLMAGGVNVLLDQWDLGAGDELTLFMEKGVRDSTRVLVVCTDKYVRKADAGEGGVGYERMIVTGELVNNIGTNKFIPVVRGAEPPTPSFLSTRVRLNFSDDDQFDASLEQLLRTIHEAPAEPKPPLGKNPFTGESAAVAKLPTEFADARALYATLLELARRNDKLGWRKVIQRLRLESIVSSGLLAWRSKNEEQQLPEIESIPDIADEAVAAIVPAFLVPLLGVESGKPYFRDQRAMLDAFLDVQGWQHSGLRVIVKLPELLGCVYHNLHGAVCLSTGQLDLALDLARMEVREAYDVERVPVWRHHGLTGWPETLGRNVTATWNYLGGAMSRWDWLADFFGTEDDFRAALTAYHLALNIMELAECLDSGMEQELAAGKIHVEIPLMYVAETERVRDRALRLLLDQRAAIPELWERLSVSRDAMEAHWNDWLKASSSWVFSVFKHSRAWGGKLPHADLFRSL